MILQIEDWIFDIDMERTMGVSGSILKFGQGSIYVGDVGILPTVNEGEAQGFFLGVSQIILPWVLGEPMKDTVSPANELSFLKKMWARLLSKPHRDAPLS